MKSYKPRSSNSSISLRYALMSMCASSVCCSVIYDHLKDDISYDRMSMLAVLFNVLSVGGMGLISVFADRVENKHTGVRLSTLLIFLGYFLPTKFGVDLKVVLLGLGSAAFYSFASSSVISRSGGKSRDIGLLIGGTGIGIACASFSGFAGHFFAPFLMILAIPMDTYQKTAQASENDDNKAPFSPLPFVFLALAYLLLSYEFSSFNFSWNVWFKTQFELLFAIGLGRAIGGFLSDLVGKMITVSATSCVGTMLIFLSPDSKQLSLLGLFLLSMSLAPTVTSFARLLPNNPALSFAIMTLASYLGQALSNLISFSRITMLLICAVLIAVTVAVELPYLLKGAKKDEAI